MTVFEQNSPLLVEFLAASRLKFDDNGVPFFCLTPEKQDMKKAIYGEFLIEAVEFTRDRYQSSFEDSQQRRVYRPGVDLTHGGTTWHIPDITSGQVGEAFRQAKREQNGVIIVSLVDQQKANRADPDFPHAAYTMHARGGYAYLSAA